MPEYGLETISSQTATPAKFADRVFGDLPTPVGNESVPDILLDHAYALETAKRLCSIDAGEVGLEFNHTAKRWVSRPFEYNPARPSGEYGDAAATVRLGWVERRKSYFDNASSDSVEEVQVLHVDKVGDGEELHTLVGRIWPDFVESEQPKASQAQAREDVLSVVEAANVALSEPDSVGKSGKKGLIRRFLDFYITEQ